MKTPLWLHGAAASPRGECPAQQVGTARGTRRRRRSCFSSPRGPRCQAGSAASLSPSGHRSSSWEEQAGTPTAGKKYSLFTSRNTLKMPPRVCPPLPTPGRGRQGGAGVLPAAATAGKGRVSLPGLAVPVPTTSTHGCFQPRGGGAEHNPFLPPPSMYIPPPTPWAGRRRGAMVGAGGRVPCSEVTVGGVGQCHTRKVTPIYSPPPPSSAAGPWGHAYGTGGGTGRGEGAQAGGRAEPAAWGTLRISRP